MKQNIEVTMTGNQTSLVVREGKASEIKEPLVINLCGDIDTVKSFVAKRYLKEAPVDADSEAIPGKVYNLQQFYKETAVVTFDKSNLSISLDVNPQDFYGPKVSGKMVESDELKLFAINTTRMYNREELVKLIRFNKRFFEDAAQHDKVLKAFQTLSLSGNTQLNAASDTRGNKNAMFDKKLDTSNIPTTFFLKLPIFKGMDPVKFLVEISIENSESSVIFWFESVDLKELTDKIVEKIFSEQKDLFSDFVIVNK